MTNKKTTRRALTLSVLSLLLCVSMLVGTTFAWFTDSVTSGRNQIIAGNLDVEVYTADGKSIEDVETLFNDVTLWEPGAVAYETLTVANLGTLELKYQLSVNFTNENTVNGYGLSQILKVGKIEGAVEGKTREEVIRMVKTWQPMKDFTWNGKLEATQNANPVTLVIYWQPSANDNNWSVNNDKKTSDGKDYLHIDLGINLFATQLMAEEDSFDETYDKDAAVFTVAEANAAMAEGKDVALANAIEPGSILWIPVGYTGTVTLHNVTVASIQEGAAPATISEENTETVSPGAKIVILGNVKVVATEEGMSAITGTKLNISGTGILTAEGKGVAAFGIGGLTTESITVEGITIAYVAGGCAYGVGADTKYYKDAPEGGAAIGSGKDGAVITLKDVAVTKAIGGSKAAAIGARYHTGVTVNIEDSVITYAEGGVSAAGIGGSRVSGDTNESGTTVNIKNSTVTAVGGAYGAGIGSGYDTHCLSKQPLCTVNITDSTINATGGKYAAGVGTGYHNAALVGEIKNSTVTAASGEKFYKASYTAAMDIGFGVIDPTREGQQTDSYLIYNGTKLTAAASDAVENTEQLKEALNGEATEIFLNKGTYTLPSLSNKEGITVQGVEGTVIGGENATTGFASNFGKSNTYKNLDFEGSSNGVRWSYANGGTTTFEDCTFAGDSTYGFHIDQSNGATFIFNNCTFSGFNAFAGDLVKIQFNNCTFLHNGNYGHTNIWSVAEFNNCTFGDKTSVSPAGSGKLFFDGVEESYHHEFIGSAESLVAFKDAVAGGDTWKGQKVVLVDDINLAGIQWTPAGNFGGTFDGNGHTISNLTVTGTTSVGFFKNLNTTAVVENVIFSNVNVSGEHYVGVVVGWEGNETANAQIRNVTVEDSTITCNTDASNDNGDKAGAICGYAVTLTIENCTVKNTTVKAYRDFGGILGYANGAKVNVKNNTVENVTLVIDNEVNYKNYTTDAEHDANPVVGEIAGGAVVQSNTVK